MAIKQYHLAVFAEVDSETGEVLRVETDGDAMAGCGDESVYNVDTQEWERLSYMDDPAAIHADTAISVAVATGWAAQQKTYPQKYVLAVVEDIEPMRHGPFATEAERAAFVRRYRAGDPERQDGLFALDVLASGAPEVYAWPGGYFEEVAS